MDVALTALTGMQNAQSALDRAATRIARVTEPTQPPDIVDLSAEMVAMMQARTDFAANANVARGYDDLTGTLLNMFA